jgi:Ca2+/Na+ antiporter
VCVVNASDPLKLSFVAESNSSLPCTKDTADPQPMAVVYVLLLFYTFAGVGIVADAFMDAITVITSVGKWHTRVDPSTGLEKNIHVKRWNPTIANLTLMALGSSAPEIMLSIIEITTGNYYSGELGPSTIVGSAAFNMLVILAVCVSAPEVGDVRKIRDTSVFAITAFCSVFAYVWLLLILTLHGEGVVDLGEGTCSFLFFPLMVYVAYLADKGVFSSTPRTQGGFITNIGEDTTGDRQVNRSVSFSAFETGKYLNLIDTDGACDHPRISELLAVPPPACCLPACLPAPAKTAAGRVLDCLVDSEAASNSRVRAFLCSYVAAPLTIDAAVAMQARARTN